MNYFSVQSLTEVDIFKTSATVNRLTEAVILTEMGNRASAFESILKALRKMFCVVVRVGLQVQLSMPCLPSRWGILSRLGFSCSLLGVPVILGLFSIEWNTLGTYQRQLFQHIDKKNQSPLNFLPCRTPHVSDSF
jgi:hypothetical protein